MSDELKTIAQIAQELNVSRQAVYGKLKSAELSRALQHETVRKGNVNLYTVKAQKLISQTFSSIMNQGETSKFDSMSSEIDSLTSQLDSLTSELTQSKEQLQSTMQQLEDKCTELRAKEQNFTELTESKAKLQSELDVLKAQLTDKDNQINLLQSQIADREKTIDSLQADKAKLNERLDKAETNISNLTTALTAAQALHGMDKQQAVIDVKADDESSEPSKTTAPDQTPDAPPQKLSFFQRIFRRK